jgi:hypothetical protein
MLKQLGTFKELDAPLLVDVECLGGELGRLPTPLP